MQKHLIKLLPLSLHRNFQKTSNEHTKAVNVQNVWLNRETPRLENTGVIARINQTAQSACAQGNRIIFVKHCDANSLENSVVWQIDAEFIMIEGDDKVN